jgi:hypothetical protein
VDVAAFSRALAYTLWKNKQQSCISWCRAAYIVEKGKHVII